MYSLKDWLESGNPYEITGGRAVALTAGDVPEVDVHRLDAFISYQRNSFNLARNVILWWTPPRVEHEALRMAGEVEGPSVLSEEAYAFRAIHLLLASLLADSIHTLPPQLSPTRHVEMLRDLLHEAILVLEQKAQQVEARAMDLRLRYDAERLRSILGALDVSPKLGELIEAAQRKGETDEHLLQLAAQVRDLLKQTARDTDTIKFIADSYWDGKLDKDAEAKKITTMVARIGEKTADALLKSFMAALVDAIKRQYSS